MHASRCDFRWGWVIAAAALAACQSPQAGEVELVARWHESARLGGGHGGDALTLPASVIKLRAIVTGPGISTAVVVEFELDSNEKDTIRIDEVPIGNDRVVMLLGLEADGWSLFTGQTDPVDVIANKTTSAGIVLYDAPQEVDAQGNALISVLINNGGIATATRDVTVRIIAAGAREMVLSNTAIGFESYDDLQWQTYSAGTVDWSLTAGDGVKIVYAVVRDERGLSSRSIASQPIILDTTGPVVNKNLLVVTSNPPGSDDAVRGNNAATEAQATVAVFSDAEALNAIASIVATADGAFADVSLGDNYTDETSANLGQGTYWIRATDTLGNTGALVPFDTDIEPPAIAFVSTVPFFVRNGVGVVINVRATDLLAASPYVELSGYPTPPTEVAVFDCATFAVGNIYECTWTSRGAEPEDFMDVVIVATKEGSGNVAEVIAEDAILFDYTNPDTLLVDTDLIVNSNPVGQDDTLFASPGVFAPFTLVELYSAWPNWPSIPATCGGYTFLKTVVADAAGGLDNVSLGDNLIGSFRARALDAAGNDRCDPDCLHSCVGQYCGFPGFCCPQGGDDIYSCPGYADLCNDVSAPTAQIRTSTAAITTSTVADFEFVLEDNGCAEPSLPLTVQCRLDDAPFAECPLSYTVTVAQGFHRLEYFGVDGLGNDIFTAGDSSGRDEPAPQSFTWRVQPRNLAFDALPVAPVQHQGYIVDAAGTAHLFVGGDRLRHFYKPPAGTFASEVVHSKPAQNIVAVADGSNVTFAFTSGEGVDLFVGTGTTGGWAIDLLEAGANVIDNSIALTRNSSGGIALAANAKLSSTLDLGAIYLWERSGSTWGAAELIVSNRSQEVRASFDASDDLWVYWTQIYSDSGSNDGRNMMVKQRMGQVWQDSHIVLADLPNWPPNYRYPTIAIANDGAPVVTYRNGTNDNSVSVKYDGTDFSATPIDLGYRGNAAVATASDGVLWYAMTGAEGSTTMGIGRLDGGSVTGTTLLGLGKQIESTSLWVASVGDIAAAVIDVAFSYLDADDVIHTGRVVHNGTAAEALVVGEQIAGMSMLQNATSPTALVRVVGVHRIIAATYDEGSDSWTTEVVEDGPAGIGGHLGGVATSTDRWVVHHDATVGAATAELFVERDDGTGWSSLGPMTLASDRATLPVVGVTHADNPVIAYRLEAGGNDDIMVTWWDGGGFVPAIAVADVSGSAPVEMAIIGDHNGSGTDGESWIVYANSTHEVRVIRVDLTDPASATAETVDTLDGEPTVSAGLNAGVEPVIFYHARYSVSGSGSASPIFRATYSGTTWAIDNLSASFVSQTGVPGTTDWIASETQEMSDGSNNYSTVQFAYDSSGLLRLALVAYDGSWEEAGIHHYAMVVETSAGYFEVLGVWPFPSLSHQWVHSGTPNRPFAHVTVLADDTGMLIWPDADREDLLSARMGDF